MGEGGGLYWKLCYDYGGGGYVDELVVLLYVGDVYFGNVVWVVGFVDIGNMVVGDFCFGFVNGFGGCFVIVEGE